MSIRRALVVSATLAIAATTLAWSPASAATGPTGTADRSQAAVGQLVRVTGTGWGTGGTGVVSVQVCGNNALDPSPDCDLADTAEGAIRAGGTFFAGITIHRPPVACPCVLLLSSDVSTDFVRVPIAIPGVPTAPLQPPAPLRRVVTVTNVRIQGSGPWTSLVGARPHRRLVFSVTNVGDVTLHNPAVDISWGHGSDPTGFVAPPTLGDLAVHQTKIVTVPVTLAPLSIGSYTVKVQVDPLGLVATSRATTSAMPWGLLVLALLAVQLVLVAVRNRLRRRLVPADGRAEDAAPMLDAALAPGLDEAALPPRMTHDFPPGHPPLPFEDDAANGNSAPVTRPAGTADESTGRGVPVASVAPAPDLEDAVLSPRVPRHDTPGYRPLHFEDRPRHTHPDFDDLVHLPPEIIAALRAIDADPVRPKSAVEPAAAVPTGPPVWADRRQTVRRAEGRRAADEAVVG